MSRSAGETSRHRGPQFHHFASSSSLPEPHSVPGRPEGPGVSSDVIVVFFRRLSPDVSAAVARVGSGHVGNAEGDILPVHGTGCGSPPFFTSLFMASIASDVCMWNSSSFETVSR